MNYAMNVSLPDSHIHRPLMHPYKNVGRFKITGLFLRENPYIIQQIYSSVIPTSVVADPINDIYYVIALSAEFRFVEIGDVIPEYICTITKNPFGHIIRFEEYAQS